MFETQNDQMSLMADYKKLIFEGLKLKYVDADDDELSEMLLHDCEAKTIEDLSEYLEDDFETDLFFDPDDAESIKVFVEERIGEDFLVLEDFEDYIFCIHEVDDFLTETDRLRKKVL